MNANELRDRRKRAGLSQQALAEIAGCSVSIVRLLESGYDPPRSAVRDRLDALLPEPSSDDVAAAA